MACTLFWSVWLRSTRIRKFVWELHIKFFHLLENTLGYWLRCTPIAWECRRCKNNVLCFFLKFEINAFVNSLEFGYSMWLNKTKTFFFTQGIYCLMAFFSVLFYSKKLQIYSSDSRLVFKAQALLKNTEK